jgi:hypothetical protein
VIGVHAVSSAATSGTLSGSLRHLSNATADAVEKVEGVDAETKAVKMPIAANIVFGRETCDVSILGFPGYVLTNR